MPHARIRLVGDHASTVIALSVSANGSSCSNREPHFGLARMLSWKFELTARLELLVAVSPPAFYLDGDKLDGSNFLLPQLLEQRHNLSREAVHVHFAVCAHEKFVAELGNHQVEPLVFACP